MSKPEFVYAIYIVAPIDKVWAALTQGTISRNYWGGRQIESDWTVGAPVRFRLLDGTLDAVDGEVLAIDPPHHLAMVWNSAKHGAASSPTRVGFTLEQATETNVRLTVTHESWGTGSVVEESFKNGWPAVLSSLKSLLETGAGLDYTKRWENEPCKA